MNIARFVFAGLLGVVASSAAETGNYVETFDTIYNNLTIEKTGTVVELRARARRSLHPSSSLAG